MFQEQLKMRVIELYYGPYQNPGYLVKKGTLRKYRFFDIAVEFNQITI